MNKIKPTNNAPVYIAGKPIVTTADNISLEVTFTAEQFTFLAQYKKIIGSKYEQDVIRLAVAALQRKVENTF